MSTTFVATGTSRPSRSVPTRLAMAVVTAVLSGFGLVVVGAGPAHAAADRIDSFDATYAMGTDGVLHATEKIVWRFGSTDPHGIKRNLITREKYDDKQDAVYGITNVQVTTSAGVSNEFSSSTEKLDKGRTEELVLKIGDPDRTVSTPTATYQISYDVTGAMRTFPDANPAYDEFFWDATGFGNPAIDQVSVSATVPGGVQETSCFYGPTGSMQKCRSSTAADGKATYSQDGIPATQGMSIGAKIKPGLIADNKPHLESDGSKLSPAARLGAIAVAVVGGVVAVGSPILGVLWWRRNGRDQRYAGLAPGTTPLAGQQAQIVPNDPDLPIPVAFSPPRIPVAEAGMLIDGQVDARETAATIIDLAVRGALKVQSSGESEFQVTLLDPDKAAAPHEMVLLTSLFGGEAPGATRDLSEQGSMLAAHNAMRDSVVNQVTARGWYRKAPAATTAGNVGFGAIAAVAFILFGIGKAVALLVIVPLLPIVITIAVIRAKLRKGQRTADGRAMDDQIEGFKTYLATAEADQLKFEEGEDIFSKYLPWAIAFELADRWAKICGDLVAMGRLPNATPYWYVGNYNMGAFNTGFLTGSLTSAATPVPSVSSGSSGTGFGGGSSFGGGGFSGGGGGGGGSSSW